jgi:hypothetical protein
MDPDSGAHAPPASRGPTPNDENGIQSMDLLLFSSDMTILSRFGIDYNLMETINLQSRTAIHGSTNRNSLE